MRWCMEAWRYTAHANEGRMAVGTEWGCFLWDVTDRTDVWVLALLPAKRNWKGDWAEWHAGGSTGTAEFPLAGLSLLTALQGLLPSRKHATGEHACRGQALQGQNTLTLFSGRHRRVAEVNVCSLYGGKKRYARTHIYLTLALWSFCFIQNITHFYLSIQRECSGINFNGKVTLRNCGVMASCIWKILKVLQALQPCLTRQSCSYASSVTGICVPRKQQRMRRLLCWEGTIYKPHLSERWLLYLRVRNLGTLQGAIKGLCVIWQTLRVKATGPQGAGNISEILFFSFFLFSVVYRKLFNYSYDSALKLLFHLSLSPNNLFDSLTDSIAKKQKQKTKKPPKTQNKLWNRNSLLSSYTTDPEILHAQGKVYNTCVKHTHIYTQYWVGPSTNHFLWWFLTYLKRNFS